MPRTTIDELRRAGDRSVQPGGSIVVSKPAERKDEVSDAHAEAGITVDLPGVHQVDEARQRLFGVGGPGQQAHLRAADHLFSDPIADGTGHVDGLQ